MVASDPGRAHVGQEVGLRRQTLAMAEIFQRTEMLRGRCTSRDADAPKTKLLASFKEQGVFSLFVSKGLEMHREGKREMLPCADGLLCVEGFRAGTVGNIYSIHI